MDEQLVVQWLANTQLSDRESREAAENALKGARTNPDFPLALARIGAHASLAVEIRQSALATLRRFIEQNWTPDCEREQNAVYIPIPDATKDQLRPMMLDLVLGTEGERKVKLSASYVVTKIATHDFPDQWPGLLPRILETMPTGSDAQLHGALVVLQDLVEDAFNGEHFFSRARDVINGCFEVSVNENRKDQMRALSVLVFRGCFDILEIVKDDYKTEVKAFAEECLNQWLPFFEQVIKTPLPARAPEPSPEQQPSNWDGPVTLKTQVVKTLIKIKTIFPSLLLPQSPAFFEATWQELQNLAPHYQQLFIDSDAQGRLEDADGLPKTVDFLVLDELDFLNQCLRAAPVQKELEAQIASSGEASNTAWLMALMGLLVSYSQTTQEEEGLWNIDVSLYLAEETSVSSNYTPRTACGDLLIKVGEWLGAKALEGLVAWTRSLFPTEGAGWRRQEASLFLFNMLVSDMQDCQKEVSPDICAAYLELVHYAISRGEAEEVSEVLRARGYLVAGVLSQSFSPATAILDRAIEATNSDSHEIVQVACIKAIEEFVKSGVDAGCQMPIITAIAKFMESKDLTELEDADDLLLTLLETLRTAIFMDVRVAVQPDNPAVDLLFLIAKHGASNFNVTIIVTEAFEEIVRTLADPTSYTAFCTKVLPTLVGALKAANVLQDDPLVTLAVELLVALVQHGSEPLPAGFVAQTFPEMARLLLASNEGEVLRPAAEAVKYMLMHDHHQVFGWHGEYKDSRGKRSGLEVCLLITDRLLGPGVEDSMASEVGGLAAELVEKAGQERLGPYLVQLLQGVATRLASAEQAQFIQSLILVFARLCLTVAADVVNLLNTTNINGQNLLQVVMSKWLENSVNFAGYDEIRQNVIALTKLYSLNDPRLTQVQVKGDLIINQSDGRIMTRSRARESEYFYHAPPSPPPPQPLTSPWQEDPDQYTIIPAQLKILKVLIEELLSASGIHGASNAAAAAAAEFADGEEDDGDEGWEDDGDTLDLSLNRTKRDLMSYLDNPARLRDDETQQYLVEFFKGAAQQNTANFQQWYAMLTPDEQAKLHELAA